MMFVLTKNVLPGFHKWQGAPDQVSFLRDRHRHEFEIYCQFDVEDADREIEIFIQQAKIENYLQRKYGYPCEFGGMSCEMIAWELLEAFDATEVKVLEDGAGGALVRK